jgi:probable HAF family extracellular repeat protein
MDVHQPTMNRQGCFFSGLHGLPGCETSHGRMAPIDSLGQDLHTMTSRFIIAALCVLGPLTCVAHGGDINGEATYISFSVPGSLGTYPMGINASMTVTGYYYVTSTGARGFLRDADGTITIFGIAGAVWTEPESINAAGDTTGFYQLPAGVPQGFLRYGNGRIITFGPPQQPVDPKEAQPISINDFDDIAGNYPVDSRFTVFIRSAEGVYNDDISFDRATVATAINGNGSVVGYSTDGEGSYSGFVLHPDGYSSGLTVPLPPQPEPECVAETFPDGINAAGSIAGWYYNRCNPENMGFVRSPDDVFTVFEAPGILLASPSFDYTSTVPHWLSIDQAGDITGSYTDKAGVQHGFVRNPYGTITSFDPPEGKQTTATSINDGGAIAGYYQYNAGGGPPVGFIRIPQ